MFDTLRIGPDHADDFNVHLHNYQLHDIAISRTPHPQYRSQKLKTEKSTHSKQSTHFQNHS